jgi:hypothetical protein
MAAGQQISKQSVILSAAAWGPAKRGKRSEGPALFLVFVSTKQSRHKTATNIEHATLPSEL